MSQQSDLSHAVWRKATRSQDQGECVELAQLPELVAVRDSKNKTRPALTFSRRQFRAFADGIKTADQ